MQYETILLEMSEGGATVTLNRPERLNSFTKQMHGELADAINVVEKSGVRALLLTGAGKGFCAGQDLSDRRQSPDGEAPDLGESVERYYNPLIRRLTSLNFPVIAAVNGVAAGAGVSIALAADMVIAARSARFILSFANIGLLPDSGGTWILPRLLGQARAMGMALTGEPISATTAEAWGLIWKCHDDDALQDEAAALIRRLAASPTKGLAATKLAIRAAWTRDLETALDHERTMMRELGRTSDYREGVTAFLEKRKARFTGE